MIVRGSSIKFVNKTIGVITRFEASYGATVTPQQRSDEGKTRWINLFEQDPPPSEGDLVRLIVEGVGDVNGQQYSQPFTFDVEAGEVTYVVSGQLDNLKLTGPTASVEDTNTAS